MSDSISTHRKVVEAIHSTWFAKRDFFALGQLTKAADVSTSSVVRTIRLLRKLGLVSYSKRAYAGRHYRVTVHWPLTVKEAIESFEYAKILKL